MTKATWSLGPSDGDLRIHTGVAGPAAKMGHRLTIGVTSWRARVVWGVHVEHDEAAALDLLGDEVLVAFEGMHRK